jgi:hypothetical protein
LPEPVEKPRPPASIDQARIVENAERVEGYLAGMDRKTFESEPDGHATPLSAAWSEFAGQFTAWASARKN